MKKSNFIKALESLNKLIIFKDLKDDQLLNKLQEILKSEDNYNSFSSELCSKLIENSLKEGIESDLWHNYLKSLLIKTENYFSLQCENDLVDFDASLYKTAVSDFKILNKLFKFSFADLLYIFKRKELFYLKRFKLSPFQINAQNQEVYDSLFNSDSAQTNLDNLVNFYKTQGSGILNQSRAFYWQEEKLMPVANPDKITFANLFSYQKQQAKLIENTGSFLKGSQAHNVLLYGDSGTGKSSSVKALLNKFYQKGLRLLEIDSSQIKKLPSILAALSKRGLKFIIFMDDLSFGEFETEYKYLKAIIEGGIESKPENVLFYATSNRRHLVIEKWQDRDSEVHQTDILNEKLSLEERFGLTILFQNPQQEEYLHIVKQLAFQENIELETETLTNKALKWSQWNQGFSGRSARQFIDQLLKVSN